MKIVGNLLFGAGVAAFLSITPGFCAGPSAAPANAPGIPAQLIVTVQPARGSAAPDHLGADDLSVVVGRIPARVVGSERLSGDSAPLQLFILLDDSSPASALGIQLSDLKAFVRALPANTQVGVGYMRNGTAAIAQAFTQDHEKAAASLRLPLASVGQNGSPYFVLSDLAKHWPSQASTTEAPGRRVVLMVTDGVDRYFDNSVVDDPYVDHAVHEALKQDILVYSIYLRDTGIYDRGSRTTLFAQSRLQQVSQQTGGYAYFQDFTDPVSLAPFLKDFQSRLNHQYQVKILAFNTSRNSGMQPVRVRSEVHGLKIEGPTRIYVR